jgi:hypothetical protein
MTEIETPRLKLVPMTLEHVRTELEEPSRLGALLGARVPEGWPPGEHDRDAMGFVDRDLSPTQSGMKAGSAVT